MGGITGRGCGQAKSDFEPNAGKSLVLGGAGAPGGWARFPLRVDLVAPGDDIVALASARVARFFADLPGAQPGLPAAAGAGRWYLFVSEKVVAIAQRRIFYIDELDPSLAARVLSRFVVRTPHGIGLGHPATMHLAIWEVGLPRILLASAVSVAGKAVGKRGLFYHVAGSRVRSIDGPTPYSAYPANVSAKLAPADPAGVARRVSAAVRAAVPPRHRDSFGGTVVIDANDLGRNVLGHDTDRSRAQLEQAFADNPLGQGREQTPLAVVVELSGAATADRPANAGPSANAGRSARTRVAAHRRTPVAAGRSSSSDR
jgi:asparagine synthase (glutamine-hydrolysing)